MEKNEIIEEINDDEKETDAQDKQGEPANDFLNDPTIISYIEKQIAEGIQKALKGKPPKTNTANPTELERKQFEKMTYKERLNLFKTNPQTYYKLSKGEN